jgi:hypothetical protein
LAAASYQIAYHCDDELEMSVIEQLTVLWWS